MYCMFQIMLLIMTCYVLQGSGGCGHFKWFNSTTTDNEKNQGKMWKAREVAGANIGSMTKDEMYDEMCKMFKAREAEIIFLRYLLCVIIGLLCVIIGLLFGLVFWALF